MDFSPPQPPPLPSAVDDTNASTSEIVRCIKKVVAVLVLISCALAVFAASRIPSFAIIFEEMLGESELPQMTSLAIKGRGLWMIGSAVVTLVAVLILRYSRRLKFGVGIALVALVINTVLYFLLDLAMSSPLRTIISQFNP